MNDNQNEDELPSGITLAEGKPNDSPSHPTARNSEGLDPSNRPSHSENPEGTKFPPTLHQRTDLENGKQTDSKDGALNAQKTTKRHSDVNTNNGWLNLTSTYIRKRSKPIEQSRTEYQEATRLVDKEMLDFFKQGYERIPVDQMSNTRKIEISTKSQSIQDHVEHLQTISEELVSNLRNA